MQREVHDVVAWLPNPFLAWPASYNGEIKVASHN